MNSNHEKRTVVVVSKSAEEIAALARLPDWEIAPLVRAGATPTPRKFRPPQGRLEQMPLHQKQALMAWLTTGGKHGQGITYREALARLQAEFGVETNVRSLCKFFQRHQRTPLPAVQATLSPDRQTLTLKINLSLLVSGQR